MLFMSYLVRRAPVLEDVPHDSVVGASSEERQDGVVREQFSTLGEAADGEDVPVEAPCVALVRAVLADAGDEALGRKPVLVFLQARSTHFVSLHDVLGRFVAIAGVQ